MPQKAGFFVLFFVFSFFFFITTAVRFSPPEYSACNSKDFGYGGTVCVCSDELECDSFSEGSPLSELEYAVYTSSKAGDRFSLRTGKMRQATDRGKLHFSGAEVKFAVNLGEVFQTILGIGGAFTDAAGINILNISSTLQQKLLSSYFSQDGIEYSIGRIPMASCDFSTHTYSYDDYEGDFQMENFSLAKEDFQLKIPLMLSAIKMSKRNLTFFGSPWASPAWMKTNGKMQGPGQLKGVAGDKYHKAWALYFAMFIKAYEDNGVNIWGLTVENEPSAGYMKGYRFQCMGFTAEMERDFIKEDLGPTLAKFGYSDVKVMMLDDYRNFVESWADTILGDNQTAKYVSGIAVHWYNEGQTAPDVLTATHKKFPNHFILNTEACAGWGGLPSERGVHLGQWSRGNEYTHSVIENLSHWSTGWVDWNLALNMQGGPNWVSNFVDSPIIVDAENGLFYKQPMFYHLGHFSKFVPPGSQRIEVISSEETSLEFIGFYNTTEEHSDGNSQHSSKKYYL
ncbi:hypothetical protein OS493_036793 [Desmophyllum pertusum]|uniref:Glucosylceramidase n=1 Tax=Desmophyllum pertusum TaxID=174260 RepID=A0A9W9Y7F1_9CNID|nr:hypothetical protein OS493_036793 [Desmophyllum pertusum]